MEPVLWNTLFKPVTNSRFSALSTAFLQLTAGHNLPSGCLLPAGLSGEGSPERRSRILPPFAVPTDRQSGKRPTRFEPSSACSQNRRASRLCRSYPSHAGSSSELRRAACNLGQDFRGCPRSGPSPVRIDAPGKMPSPAEKSRHAQGRGIDPETRTHRRSERHALQIVALGARRLGLDNGIGESAYVFGDRLVIKGGLADTGMDDSCLLDAELDSAALGRLHS